MTLLPSHYSTFVDVMEFHDATIEVITSLATVQFNFDIVSAWREGERGGREGGREGERKIHVHICVLSVCLVTICVCEWV